MIIHKLVSANDYQHVFNEIVYVCACGLYDVCVLLIRSHVYTISVYMYIQ